MTTSAESAKDLKFVVVMINHETGKRTFKPFHYTRKLGMPDAHGRRDHWDDAPRAMKEWVNALSTAKNTIIVCEPTKIVTRPGTPLWAELGDKS